MLAYIVDFPTKIGEISTRRPETRSLKAWYLGRMAQQLTFSGRI